MVETMPSHGHARDHEHLDAVPGHAADLRRGDDLRVHAHLHRLEHVAAGEVDGGGAVEVQGDAGLVGRDQRVDDVLDVAAGEVVGLESLDRDVEPGLHRRDAGQHDGVRRHLAQPHAHQVTDKLQTHAREEGSDPQTNRNEVKEQDKTQDDEHDNENARSRKK